MKKERIELQARRAGKATAMATMTGAQAVTVQQLLDLDKRQAELMLMGFTHEQVLALTARAAEYAVALPTSSYLYIMSYLESCYRGAAAGMPPAVIVEHGAPTDDEIVAWIQADNFEIERGMADRVAHTLYHYHDWGVWDYVILFGFTAAAAALFIGIGPVSIPAMIAGVALLLVIAAVVIRGRTR